MAESLQDTPLARMYAGMRTLRLADGPDEVHRRTIARIELSKHQAAKVTNIEEKAKAAKLNNSFFRCLKIY